MVDPRKKYWGYRLVSFIILGALLVVLESDLKQLIDTSTSPSSLSKSQQIVPPDIYIFSSDGILSNNGTINDFGYIGKPTVPVYRFSKIIKPKIQQDIDTSGIKIEKIKLAKSDKIGEKSVYLPKGIADKYIYFNFPKFTKDIGFSWFVNQGMVDIKLTEQNFRRLSSSITQINNNLFHNEAGKNNKFDEQTIGSYGNKIIVTHIGEFNYTDQILYNTFSSDFKVRSIGDYNTTRQNIYNASNVRFKVTQNGSFNRVKQNLYSRTALGTYSTTLNDARQIGSYNSYSSQQAGISNTIKAIQLGNFNNIDITQEGNSNSVKIRQSGSGNTVSVQQN